MNEVIVQLVRALAAGAAAPPRIALRVEEAAASLGVSPDFFDQHVRNELRLIRQGRLVLVPVAELERWCERSAARVLDEGAVRR